MRKRTSKRRRRVDHGGREQVAVKRFDFGRRFRELRVELGLTQETVAARSRLSAKHLSGVENGRKSPTIRAVERLVVDGLGMTLAEFFGGSS